MTDNIAFVQSLYAAFGRGDVQTILDACHPAITWVSNGDPAVVPWGGTQTGTGGVTRFFSLLGEHLHFEAFEPRRFAATGDTVAVFGRTRARHRSGGHGVFDCEWAHEFTMRDGKLARFHEYYDTAAVERALAA